LFFCLLNRSSDKDFFHFFVLRFYRVDISILLFHDLNHMLGDFLRVATCRPPSNRQLNSVGHIVMLFGGNGCWYQVHPKLCPTSYSLFQERKFVGTKVIRYPEYFLHIMDLNMLQKKKLSKKHLQVWLPITFARKKKLKSSSLFRRVSEVCFFLLLTFAVSVYCL